MKTSNPFLLAIAPVFLLAACGGGDDDADDRLDLADPKVRLVHAVPLAPNVSLFRNGQAQASAVTDLPYKGASNYFDVSTNTDTWQVRTATTPALTVGSVMFPADRGNKYTLIAVPDSSSATELVLIDDPYNKGIVSNNARVRVFNAAFNAGAIDVYLSAARVPLESLQPTFSAVGHKQAQPASGEDSKELEGGGYSLRITHAGQKDVIFNATVDLAKNADWLLTSVPGGLGPDDIKLLVVQSDADAPATELPTDPE